MPTYTFATDSTHQFVNWSSPANWTGGVVANSADADVVIPDVTVTATGSVDLYFVSILTGQSFVANSLNIESDYLLLYGTLSVANGFMSDGELDMDGGSLSVGSLRVSGYDIQGFGQISSAGTIVNQGLIIGSGLTLAFGGFQNSGVLEASQGPVVLTTDPGGFENLIGSTLNGGTYSAGDAGGVLDFNVGGLIVTDAATINLGSLTSDVIASFDVNTGRYVPLQSTLQTIAPAGVLSLEGSGFTTANSLTVQGTLALTDGAALSAAQLDVAAGGAVLASGTILAPIENDGIVTASLDPSTPENLGRETYSDRSSGDLLLQSAVTGTGSLVVAPAVVASTFYPVVEAGPPVPVLTYAVATIELAGPDGENISFAGDMGNLVLDKPQSFTGTIIPFGSGDDVILAGLSLSSISGYQYSGDTSGGVLTLSQATGSIDLNFSGDYSTASFLLSPGSQALSTSPPSVVVTETAPCFAAGTHIRTLLGDVLVEDLVLGELVSTASGDQLPVVWIGRLRLLCHAHPNPESVQPVRIARHAFAPKQPSRDLLLSPDHAVFVDGVLIPVKQLINDLTISQISSAEVEYYHVELSRHDILLAEGLPAESYLDTGDRSKFGASGGVIRLCPDFGPKSRDVSAVWDAAGFARLVVTGPILETVRDRLNQRALLLMPPPACASSRGAGGGASSRGAGGGASSRGAGGGASSRGA